MSQRPLVTFRLSSRAQAAELERWIKDARLGSAGERSEVLDQVFVRQILVELAGGIAREARADFELRADRAIAEAQRLGMFAPLLRLGLTLEKIGELQRRAEAGGVANRRLQ